MKIGGLQKLTLIDFPGKVACTVFTVGCNFRCPFCHNPELVLVDGEVGGEDGKESDFAKASKDEEQKFFDFLKKRKGKLDGVCITGGEPTLWPDILDFIRKIKKMGYAVKLDTNGTRPDVLDQAYREKLVDFVAMDIKNCLSQYKKTCGGQVDLARIKKSVDLIRRSHLPYEFRTTVVPKIHRYHDFDLIARWLKGADRYVLQAYRDEGKILDERLRKRIGSAKMNLEKIKRQIEKNFGEMAVR